MRLPGVLVACLFPVLAQAQQPGTSGERASATRFVRRFYEWYVPLARGDHGDPVSTALSRHAAWFTPAIRTALRADSAAQAQSPDEVVGLDGDPFLNAQDFCERYEVGAATPATRGYQVAVFGVCSGKRNARPDVIVELARVGRAWVFTNFDYPNERRALSTDLLSLLRSLHRR
jgi:hypothetical protein